MPLFTIPPTIDRTGATDVTQDLNDYIASVIATQTFTAVNPGTILALLGSVYRVEGTINYPRPTNLIVDWNQSRLIASLKAPYGLPGSGAFYSDPFPDQRNFDRVQHSIFRGNNFKLLNFHAVGSSTTPGVYTGNEAYVGQSGVFIEAGNGITVAGWQIANMYGDFIEAINSPSGGAPIVAQNIEISDGKGRGAGRQGISNAGALNMMVERVDIANAGRHMIDLESDDVDGSIPITGFTLRASTIGHGKLGFFAAVGNSVDESDITIGGLTAADGNKLVGQSMDVVIQSAIATNAPRTYHRRSGILIGHNTSDTQWGDSSPPAGMISLRGIDDITVINNQALIQVDKTTGKPIDEGVLLDNCSGYQGKIHDNLFTGAAHEWRVINPFTVTPPPPPPITGWDAGNWDDGTWDDSTVVAPSSTPPGPPRNVVVTAGDSQVLIQWTAPSSDGGQPITNWVVTSYLGSAPQTTISVPPGPLVTTDVFAVNGSTYTYTVRASNSVGNGPDSAHSAPVTPVAAATHPAAPTVTSVSGSDGFISAVWTRPADGGSAITGYVLTLYIAGVAQSPSSVGPQTFASVPAINDTTYTLTVKAVNSIGQSAESAHSSSVTPTAGTVDPSPTIPDVPTNLHVQAGDASVVLFWDLPADGGSPILSYVITPYIGGVAQATHTEDGLFPATQVTGLTNGTVYSFTVEAINAVGTTAESAHSSTVTPVGSGITVPAAPDTLKVTAGDGTVLLLWLALDDGGDAIISYTVTTYVAGDAVDTTLVPAGLPFALLNLANDITYQFTVHSTNTIGDSPESAFSPAATPTSGVIITPPPPPPPDSSVVLDWTFFTPTELVVPPISEEALPLANRLFRHYQSTPRGLTIWELTDGTLTFDQPYPSIEDTGANRASLHATVEDGQWSNLTAVTYERVFLGGHKYRISNEDTALLTALMGFLTDNGYDWHDWLVQDQVPYILTSEGGVLAGIGDLLFVRSSHG